VDKLTRPFSDPYVVLAGCAVGVAVAVAVLLAAAPAFAGDGGGLSPDDATSTRKAPTGTSPSTQSPPAFPAGFGRRTLRRGARGGDVRYLQSLLGRLGFRTGVDGMFGSGTQTKVRAWERSVRGLVDGRVPPGQAREMLRRAGTAQQSQPAQPQQTQTAPAGQYVFPIRGAHNYGTSINRFGPISGRDHKGQDVLSACGVRLVAAHAGRVSTVDSGGDTGNYLVIQSTDRTDMVYMHMRSLALVREGQNVTAGQLVGYVGQTGNATTCHLHFELWTPHWWDGGHPFDPLPRLKQWDAAS
jgi:peptidoglycan hydrolase-like protein with peptidoglycan-binding domain